MRMMVLLVAVPALTFGSALAQQLQLQSAVQLDCSAYQQNADGSWVVLRANKMLEREKVLREIAPGDDLEKLKDRGSLYPLLNALCARPK